jgi:hypothetical protein
MMGLGGFFSTGGRQTRAPSHFRRLKRGFPAWFNGLGPGYIPPIHTSPTPLPDINKT